MTTPVIFVSYSHVDEEIKDRLLAHIGVLQESGLVNVWSDDRIKAGAAWELDIDRAIAHAKVAVLLITANFLTSDFIVGREVPALLRRREREGLVIYPIIAKACAWRTVNWLTEMNVRPKGGQPVWRDDGRHIDEELASIVESIARIINQNDAGAAGTAPTRSDNVRPARAGIGPQLDEESKIEPLPQPMRSPNNSVGLFVGVGDFDARSYLSRLHYAPDDAVALAHLFVLELALISPKQVYVALGGTPRSIRAQKWLDDMVKAEVRIVPATKTELLYTLHEIEDLGHTVNSLALMSFSTHGYVEEDRAYLMPADGARRFVHETGLPLDLVDAVFGKLKTKTKLLLVDACRTSLEGGIRGSETPDSEFQRVLKGSKGLALLSSCDAGQSSWESPQLEQGVFTNFLLEGLRGGAKANAEDGFIYLENVFAYALSGTNSFVRRNLRVEQLPWYGGDESMRGTPLAVSTDAQKHANEVRESRRLLDLRKQEALRRLNDARLTNPGLISLKLQAQIEKQLETSEGEEFEDLVDNLMALRDKKTRSCKVFIVWWKTEHGSIAVEPLARPHRGSIWENTLGMKFVPLDDTLFGVWQTRVQDFREFVKDTGFDATAGHFYSYSPDEGRWKDQGHHWMNPGFEQGPNHPVVGITWEDAAAFCQWITEKERLEGFLTQRESYRLPTDEEWSRAVGPTKYPWGEDWPPLPESGKYAYNQPLDTNANSKVNVYVGTDAVGTFRPNQRGIYDLGGNVWEWCHDWYVKEMNPSDLRTELDYLQDDGGGHSYHFLRGASWFNQKPHELLCAYRNPAKYPDARFANVGFRCVLELEPEISPDEFHV